MDQDNFVQLVTRHLSNEASFKEIEVLRELLKDEKYNKLFKWVAAKWEEDKQNIKLANFNMDRGMDKLVNKIRKYEPDFQSETLTNADPVNKVQPITKQINYWRYLPKIAVSVLLLLMVGLSYYHFLNNPIKTETSWKEIVTKPGQKSMITLADGTLVKLNAGSKFKYPEKFTDSLRQVYLEGEAYFKVKSMPEKPFIVHSQELSTKVLGTVFNVAAYPDESDVEVTLVEGKVEVIPSNKQKESYILSPNEKVVFNKPEKSFELKNEADVQKVTSWKNNVLLIENEPLSVVTKKLKMWYGVEVELGSPGLENCKLKARFENESLKTVLQVLKYTFDLTIINENGKITLTGNGCK
ncbi:FecR family protein [Chondrinema litorale]|uniref:FecR family protein n=1 Tax=Chondrinema litorale TaxID=2994555 RepID=UPI002542AAAE|nr:FecR domain-containing protein [Chondrinema litorale]UZR97543.1 FecR domain-containing protein [Chondrinema litorale]